MEHVHRGVAGGVGGALAVCALLLSGVVGRPGMGWALWAGSALQVLVIAAGAVVPAMYILGAIFAALWVTGIWLARRLQTSAAPAARSGPPETEPATPTTRRRPAVRLPGNPRGLTHHDALMHHGPHGHHLHIRSRWPEPSRLGRVPARETGPRETGHCAGAPLRWAIGTRDRG